MTVTESKTSRKATAFIGEAMPLTAALSPRRIGIQVTIAWENGKVANVHHGDMREVHSRRQRQKA